MALLTIIQVKLLTAGHISQSFPRHQLSTGSDISLIIIFSLCIFCYSLGHALAHHLGAHQVVTEYDIKVGQDLIIGYCIIRYDC